VNEDIYRILVENEESEWDDKTGARYHFPKNRYYNRLSPGMKFIYYKGRTGNRGPHYFGYGEISRIYPAADGTTSYYADIVNYNDFPVLVDFKLNDEYLEDVTRSNYFRQNSVRPISKDRFYRILELGGLNLEIKNDQVPEIEVSLFPPLEEININLGTSSLLEAKKPKTSKKVSESIGSYSTKNAKKYGDRGENIVMKHLRDTLPKSEAHTLRHHAVENEKDGYDISYVNSAGEKIYIEVKATNAATFNSFIITINELNAAEKHGNAYKIYLVNNVTSKKVNIDVIDDIAGLLEIETFEKTPITFKIQKA
jgi:hypothetical protein